MGQKTNTAIQYPRIIAALHEKGILEQQRDFLSFALSLSAEEIDALISSALESKQEIAGLGQTEDGGLILNNNEANTEGYYPYRVTVRETFEKSAIVYAEDFEDARETAGEFTGFFDPVLDYQDESIDIEVDVDVIIKDAKKGEGIFTGSSSEVEIAVDEACRKAREQGWNQQISARVKRPTLK